MPGVEKEQDWTVMEFDGVKFREVSIPSHNGYNIKYLAIDLNVLSG